jgi:uncharacterized protein (DUF433 family)
MLAPVWPTPPDPVAFVLFPRYFQAPHVARFAVVAAVRAIIVLEALNVANRKGDGRTGRLIGRFVVSDPAICHGQPTFRGTRILVADVLEQVAAGIAWETIVEEWRGDVPSEAIAEAVRLARQAFRDHSAEYAAAEYVLERARA